MAKLEIENIDDEVLRRLEQRAGAEGKPLGTLVRDMLAAAAPPRLSMEEKLESIREMHRRHGPFPNLPPPEDVIREAR
ncbi:FitA-like ribbon-helix-helix domain-containing protein [Salinarimonas chemoclinalis]|uniref:FitA-like ribbon-helix-helix domain-containing protein n=1 Tax=Salinarimonas chemoclinalis TaxID=3241599 RepID=UPI0035579AE6